MPFTGKSFAGRHNKAFAKRPAVASKAAQMANAMMKSGTPEGIAIATANKRAPAAAAKAEERGEPKMSPKANAREERAEKPKPSPNKQIAAYIRSRYPGKAR